MKASAINERNANWPSSESEIKTVVQLKRIDTITHSVASQLRVFI
jgi:hypothetical protein